MKKLTPLDLFLAYHDMSREQWVENYYQRDFREITKSISTKTNLMNTPEGYALWQDFSVYGTSFINKINLLVTKAAKESETLADYRFTYEYLDSREFRFYRRIENTFKEIEITEGHITLAREGKKLFEGILS